MSTRVAVGESPGPCWGEGAVGGVEMWQRDRV